jgi:hypothetical protein
MGPVFQEIIEIAIPKLKEALSQESEKWDSDAWEQEVRQFIRQLGQGLLRTWTEVKTIEAGFRARFCPCGQKRQVDKQEPFWWLTIFGQVCTEVPELRCPKCHGRDRPFQRLTGLRCRGKSLALERVLTDFGAEKSYARASSQLKEHYGIELDPSSIRQVVIKQASRAEELVTKEHQGAIASYQREKRRRDGAPCLIVESDGCMVRTGKLELDPQGGLSPKRLSPKRRRQTQWKEVRLSTVQLPQEDKRGYAAVLGLPPRVGEQMFALALCWGYGDNTWVHGVGDGAPWIAQQMAEVFPRHSYLLDRYHLLEHIYGGVAALPGYSAEAVAEWVAEQVARIDQNKVGEVVAECRTKACSEPGRTADGGEHPLSQLARYLEHQKEHLDYKRAREEGLPIGSGAVEGGHRHVIQARIKLPGTWWKEESINPMLALRTLRANGQWEAFWN